MLALAETAVPGLSELVEYTEVSTPLTFEHYTAHPAGAFYGMPATPQRYKSRPLGPRTAVPGLLLSGQDAGSLGIAGAMMGGVAAACQALGPRGLPMIASAVRTGPSARPAARPRVLPETGANPAPAATLPNAAKPTKSKSSPASLKAKPPAHPSPF